MELLAKLTAKTILEDKILTEVFEETDEIKKARLLLSLMDRAEELGVKTKFSKLVTAYKKVERSIAKEKSAKQSSFNNYTQFDYFDDGTEMYCGNWIANVNGVNTFNMFGEKLACYHPIMPVQRLINAETGKEKVKLAFQKGGRWKEIVVDKGIIASSNKIVSLADYGVSVTSETSKALVQFLSDIENFNVNIIKTKVSTSKLGWINGEFMPYGADIIFDNETRFKSAYESIHESGNRDIWFKLAKEIRNLDRVEPKVYLIGSLASVLIEPLNALPFIINLWGDTGKGKTVAIMFATSVWAYPGGNDYVTDPKSTITALELRLDFLNNLPIIIDDMAQLKEKYSGDFSELVYMLCSGKGKDRANSGLGLNKSTTWRNVILTNGEHSLVTETMQGGAVNRIIDVEMDDGYIFDNGNEIVETIKQNFGFAGKEFIEIINNVGIEEIKEIQRDFLNRIKDAAKILKVEKEEKQILPMSILLTADKLAADYMFKDGQYLDFNYCVDLLKNKGEVSENSRAYEYIMSEVAINMNKFRPDNYGEYKNEVWGCIEKDYVVILNNVFNRICEKGNFSGRAFLSWANKQGLLQGQGGKNTKPTRINGGLSRCVWIKIPLDIEKGDDGFVPVEEYVQEELPFN